nr:MAG: hypothetical protein DIU58_04680 [Sphaerobacter thermophilus]
MPKRPPALYRRRRWCSGRRLDYPSRRRCTARRPRTQPCSRPGRSRPPRRSGSAPGPSIWSRPRASPGCFRRP